MVFSSAFFVRCFLKPQKSYSQEEMPVKLRFFLDLLPDRIAEERLLKCLSPFEVLNNVLPGISINPRYVSLNQYFLKTKTTYILSAPVFAPVLGSVFYYLKL